jgi:hypothetical protein
LAEVRRALIPQHFSHVPSVREIAAMLW